MASGILGQSAPAALTYTSVYTVPSAGGVSRAVFNISLVNTGGSPLTVRVAVAASGTPAASEFIEYDTVIPVSGVLERGGLVAQSGKIVVVYSTVATLAVSVYGYEE